VLVSRKIRAACYAMAAVTVVLIASGCSSGGGSSQSSAGTGVAASGTSGGTASSSLDACMTAANALVTKYEAPIKAKIPTTSVNVKPYAGRTIYDIVSVKAPFPVAVSQGLQDAGAAVGVHVVVFDGQGNTNLWTQGINEAVAQHAAAIVITGVDPSSVAGALQAAYAAHIPVISSGNATFGTPNNGLFDQVDADGQLMGKITAAYALSQTSCKTNIGYLAFSAYTVSNEEQSGIQSEINTACPSCSMAIANGPTDLAPTDIVTAVSALLRAHPDINFLIPAFDAAALYAMPALTQAGSNVKMISTNGDEANLQEIANKSPQVADVLIPPGGYDGFRAFDDIVRAWASMAPENFADPIGLVTVSSPNITNAYGSFGNYQAEFEKLWGLS
jgi:ribose transport system substrate-binding protein